MSANIDRPVITARPEEDRPSPSRNGESAEPQAKAIVAMPRVKLGDPAARLIRAAFQAALARVQAADPDARRGDVEGIHRLRTSTRRLRSELRTVRDLIDSNWRTHLEEELKWLAGMLGSVRDLDILSQRLHSAWSAAGHGGTMNGNGAISSGADRLQPFFQALRERHLAASRALRDALRGARYQQLLAELETAIDQPALKDDAWEPCRSALPPLGIDAWKRLKKDARALGPADPDPSFHEVRKLAKRARYTAELIAPALGRRAHKASRRFIRLTTSVQDTLGEHQDAIVAITEIERFMAENARGLDFLHAAHDLLETQRAAARESREKFSDVWAKLDRKKSLRWVKVKHGTHA
jgi:CHAD domain-containing protein